MSDEDDEDRPWLQAIYDTDDEGDDTDDEGDDDLLLLLAGYNTDASTDLTFVTRRRISGGSGRNPPGPLQATHGTSDV